jgi:hypothetical protein
MRFYRFVCWVVLFWSLGFGMSQSNLDSYNLITGEKIALDDEGNIYMAGTLIVDFIDTPERGKLLFLSKHDSEGKQVWRKSYGDTSPIDLKIDQNNDLYLLIGSSDSNSRVTSALWKLTINGELIWSKGFDQQYGDTLYIDEDNYVNIVTTNIDNIFEELVVTKFDTGGEELSVQRFEPEISYKKFSSNVFMNKYGLLLMNNRYKSVFRGIDDYINFVGLFEPDGLLYWSRNFRGHGPITSGTIDDLGNSFVTGWTDPSYTLGIKEYTEENSSSTDGFIASYDLRGETRFIKQFGEGHSYSGKSIVVNDKGNVIVVGDGNGNIGGEHLGASDVFIKVYSPEGTSLWEDRLGTKEFDRATNVFLDRKGFIYITGFLHQTWDDKHKSQSVAADLDAGKYAFLTKYNFSGEQLWLETFEFTSK